MNKFYIGISNDPERRLYFHNKGLGGRKAFTKRTNDWVIVWKKEFETKAEALKKEHQLKSFKNRDYLLNI